MEDCNMFKVKLSIDKSNNDLGRQTPGYTAQWGNYKFFINQDIDEADFWAIYSKGNRKNETCEVSQHNTILIIGEPASIYHYSKSYINQFERIIVCQNHLQHPNQRHNQPAQPWFVGRIRQDKKHLFTLNYDDIKSITDYKKRKLISVITSNKAFTKGHRKRIDFVIKLKEYYGEKLDVFGSGFNSFEDKWDVIAPYKYHIVIENSSYPDYWTEKLSDCYLAGAYPLYYGCSNLNEYFDEKAYKNIDINNLQKSIQIINQTINNNYYEKYKINILKAKELVLDKYNLFNLLTEEFDKMNPNALKMIVKIKKDESFIDPMKLKIMFIDRIISKLHNKDYKL